MMMVVSQHLWREKKMQAEIYKHRYKHPTGHRHKTDTHRHRQTQTQTSTLDRQTHAHAPRGEKKRREKRCKNQPTGRHTLTHRAANVALLRGNMLPKKNLNVAV